ncbi:MAG: response regulator [Sporichthyaceae bacterium]
MSKATGPAPIRVLVVDDHVLFRRGLQLVLAGESEIEVVGEACDGVQGVELARRLQPEVVLLDIGMPRMSGLVAAGRITEVAPCAQIVMLTMSDEPADRVAATAVGAVGYLLKESSIDEVCAAIHAAHAQGRSPASHALPSSASRASSLSRISPM